MHSHDDTTVCHKQWPLERVRLKVTHHRDSLQTKDRFVREIELNGLLDEAQLAKLLDVSMRCPVLLTIERGSIVEPGLRMRRWKQRQRRCANTPATPSRLVNNNPANHMPNSPRNF
jgi:hypothetical protein